FLSEARTFSACLRQIASRQKTVLSSSCSIFPVSLLNLEGVAATFRLITELPFALRKSSCLTSCVMFPITVITVSFAIVEFFILSYREPCSQKLLVSDLLFYFTT